MVTCEQRETRRKRRERGTGRKCTKRENEKGGIEKEGGRVEEEDGIE